MKRLLVGLFFGLLLGLAVVPHAWAGEPIPDNEGVPVLRNGRPGAPGALHLGPIEGWTTGWHPAPAETAIPVGTKVQLSVSAPEGTLVRWQEAIEIERTADKSVAECIFSQLGGIRVSAKVSPAAYSEDGAGEKPLPARHTVLFHVIDPAAEPIRVSPIKVSVEKMVLGGDAPGQAGLSYFFSDESIAGLQKLDGGRFRTSLGRTLRLSVDVTPATFAPLIEWRIDGLAGELGRFKAQAFGEIGLHRIEVGPLQGAESIEVETYSVRITGPGDLGEQIATGQPVTFRAETEPPGFEEEVTWISATKFGTASPAAGRGESFTVQFEDTWGSLPDGAITQWIGVKADQDTVGQDKEAEVNRLQTSAYVAVQVVGFADPFEFFLQGAGPGDTVVSRAAPPYRDGRVIETEILSMDLTGVHLELGPVTLQLEPTARSFGSIENVVTDADGNLIRGESRFDVLPRILLPQFGLELHTAGIPVTMTSLVTELPPLGSKFTFGNSSVTVYQGSEAVGEITAVDHEIEECDCPDDADTGSWNGAGNNQDDNNCYNYGTNQQNGTYAQPGHASGSAVPIPDSELNCADVSARAQGDGVTSNGNSMVCPANTCLVALYAWGGEDYHWYRKNDDGNWSHKMDSLPATTDDESGNNIGGNLGGADTGSYVFCEYMCVPWDLTVSGLLLRAPDTKAIASPAGFLRDVQILTRSGVPNLGWDLTDPAEIQFIQNALVGLPSVPDPNWPSLLAYTGFGIYDRTDLGLPPSVRVWNGVIELQSGSSISYYADVNGLEDFLVQGATDRGFGGEIP